jgi:hypothetical protein
MPGDAVKARRVAPVVEILVVGLAISITVLGVGFVAVSDDDFARVTIAQRFVAHPTLDPSGTSWLPAPFLILGTVMSAFGRSLAVARVVAVVEGLAALLLLYRAARNLGYSERAAVAGTYVAAFIPTAARLGVSFQPEALTAGLILFAASTLSLAGRERVAGGFAIGAATLCRYEAWPAACIFAIYCAVDAVRERHTETGARAAAAAGLAILPAMAWMDHGMLAHGSALFFLHRVAQYRQALGEAEPVLASLIAYPMALVRGEPELVALATVAVFAAGAREAAAQVRASTEPRLARLAKPAMMLAAVFVFLVTGRLMGGAPTHHDERPLLPVYWALAIVVAERLIGSWRPRRDVAIVVAAFACGLAVRFTRSPEPFSDRSAEIAIGSEARRFGKANERLLVETDDYGYFAVIAAFGAPELADTTREHDPRKVAGQSAFASETTLASTLAARGARWLVTPHGDRATLANRVGTSAAQNEKFVLFRTNASKAP